MVNRLVVIGGSAGSIKTISSIIKVLPQDFPAAVCVVVHIPRAPPSTLPAIFSRSGAIRVIAAADGMALEASTVYVAPANFHMLIDGKTIHLQQGPPENFHRPAIDVLFRSAAYAFRSRLTAVLLSGYQDDGSLGLITVKNQRGIVIIQDPDEIRQGDMPRNALKRMDADFVLAASQIGAYIRTVASRTFRSPLQSPLSNLEVSPHLRYVNNEGQERSCEGEAIVCDRDLRSALAAALRVLDGREKMLRSLAKRAVSQGNHLALNYFERQSDSASSYADIIRQLLFRLELSPKCES